MIVVDTSALMAIILDEKEASACAALLETDGRVLISAVTVAEALIVSERRGVGEAMALLIDQLGFEVHNVTAAVSRRVSDVYGRWGKGVHRAGLNFCDCFAYELAWQHACALLCVGDDFRRTDIVVVP